MGSYFKTGLKTAESEISPEAFLSLRIENQVVYIAGAPLSPFIAQSNDLAGKPSGFYHSGKVMILAILD